MKNIEKFIVGSIWYLRDNHAGLKQGDEVTIKSKWKKGKTTYLTVENTMGEVFGEVSSNYLRKRRK